MNAAAAQGVDLLQIAGERLDSAAAELNRLCLPAAPLPDEMVFGFVEAELIAARDTYRRLVAERLGDEFEAVARRLAL